VFRRSQPHSFVVVGACTGGCFASRILSNALHRNWCSIVAVTWSKSAYVFHSQGQSIVVWSGGINRMPKKVAMLREKALGAG
jgi:hypothetical protein